MIRLHTGKQLSLFVTANMAKGGKGAAAAAAAAAAEVSSGVPPNIAHGVRVTLGFFVVYYAFLFAQGTLKRKLRAYYAAQGKKVCTLRCCVDVLRKLFGSKCQLGNAAVLSLIEATVR